MATNSGNNGTTPTTQPEQLKAVAAAVAETENITVADFMSRVEHAAQLLADVGRELGSAGEQDERELIACAEQYRADMTRMVEKIVARHRRRVGDLERVLGKLAG